LRLHTSKSLPRGSRLASKGLAALLVVLVALTLCARAQSASAVTPAQVSSANSEIQSAFSSAYAAERSGGNATSLDVKLNEAIQLVQMAEAENATDPAQAEADLQNATSLAQGVAEEAPATGQAGSAARQSAEATSVGAAFGVLAVASLIYVFGGRVYRMAWLRLHRDYVVRPANG
jgi:hypothetical protein